MDIQNSPTYQRIYSPADETKLCIIVDSNTPIVTKIPVAPGRLTLGAFKSYSSLPDDRYKFYFKSHDSEFGTVKEEIVDNDSSLPVEDGRVVVWAISNRNAHKSALFLSANHYDKLPYETKIDTDGVLFRQSADIKFDQRTMRDNMCHQMVHVQPIIFAINLYLNSHDTLGLTILCPNGDAEHDGLYINRIQPDSIAARDGCIRPGDRLVEINGIDLRQMPSGDAVVVFKNIVDHKGAMNILLHRHINTDQVRASGNLNGHHISTPVRHPAQNKAASSGSGFNPATELPFPVVETDAFVTPQRGGQRNINPLRGTHSLPRSLTPRSLYTTSNIDTLASSTDLRLTLDSQSVYRPTTPSSLRQVGVALHCSKDSITTIYSHLKSDVASLDIKDRQWLKVVVKNAFIGSALVKWLSRNVYGFGNRTDTKRYANRMLSLGLITSPMSGGNFSEKCYYVLT